MPDAAIKAYFGGDTSGLKTALNEAGAALEHFNENTSRIQHRLLSGFLGFEAIRRVQEWASEAVKGAQETREEFEKLGRPIDESTRSLAEFGDGLGELKKGTIEAVGGILSLFTRAGEGWGIMINRVRGVSAEQERLAEQTGREADKQEKQRDDAIKKHAQDGEKAVAIEKQIADAREKNAQDGEDLENKWMDLIDKKTQLEKEEAVIVGDSDTARLLRAQKQLEIEKTIGEAGAVEREMKKQAAEEEKKQGDDALAYVKEYDKLNSELNKQRIAALSPAEQINELEKQNVALKEKQARYDAEDLEYKRLAVTIGENEKTIAEEHLKEEKKISDEHKIQGDLIKLNTKLQSDFLSQLYGLRSDKDLSQASDAALKEVIRKNNSQKIGLDPGSTFRYGDSMTITRLNNEIVKAQAELDFRNKIRGDVSVNGIEGARRMFTGDPLNFDRVVQEIAQQKTDARDSSLTLKRIEDFLTKR